MSAPVLYIASSLNNSGRIRLLRDRFLAERDIGLTYDWTEHGQVVRDDLLAGIAANEVAGVIAAKCVLVVLPARSGSHFEIGLAFGLRIPIVMLFDKPDYVSFHRRPEIIKCTDEDVAISTVSRIVADGYTYTDHLMDDYYRRRHAKQT